MVDVVVNTSYFHDFHGLAFDAKDKVPIGVASAAFVLVTGILVCSCGSGAGAMFSRRVKRPQARGEWSHLDAWKESK